MLAYAEKLTREPAAVSDDDIHALRDAGFSDAQVWEMTFTTSIFAMFNRMADAFGLQPPEQLLTALERP
jgi:alkylhydroperoxidase family enzyme